MIGPVLRLATGVAGRPLSVARRGSGLAFALVRAGLAGPDRNRRALGAVTAAATGLLDDAGLAVSDRQRLAAIVGRRVGSSDTLPVPPGAVLGEDVAATAGAVVLRACGFELIQYLPRTATVRATPLLVVPPPGRPFVAADLAPGRSFVEHLVAAGQQVLLVSWGTDGDPPAAVAAALGACERISRRPTTAVLGYGAGAATAAAAAAAAPGRIAALTLVADGSVPPPPPSGPARVVHRDLPDAGWWTEHAAWLREHTGPDVEAPAELGGRGLPPLVPAPGELVAQSPGRSCS